MNYNYNGYTGEDFTEKQLGQIEWDEAPGLSVEQIEVFAHPYYCWEQMGELARGFYCGLTIEQVKFYANKNFAEAQMCEIRLGFYMGLTLEQVQTYADPDLSWREMEIRRLKLLEECKEMKYNYNGYTEEAFNERQQREIRHLHDLTN